MDIKEFLKKIILFLGIAAILTPAIFNPNVYFPYIMSKMVYFRILVEIMLVLYLALAVLDKKYRPRWNWLSLSVVVFGVAILLSGIFGVNFYNSFWSSNERMEGIIGIWHYIIFFLVLSFSIKDKKDWLLIMKSSAILAMILGVISFYQGTIIHAGRMQSGGGLIGLSGNPSFFAVYLIFNAYLSLYLALLSFKERKKEAYLWLCSFIVLSGFIFLTACRGAAIGWFCGLLFFLMALAYHFRKTKYRYLGLGGLAVILLVVIGFFALAHQGVFKNNMYLSKLSNLSLKDANIESRIYCFKVGINALKSKPVFGWGQDNFNAAYFTHYNPGVLKYSTEFYFDRAHNKLIEVLVNNGIFGFLSYLCLWLAIIYFVYKIAIRKKEDFLAIMALASCFISYFIQNIFLFDIHDSYLMFFFVLSFLCYLYRVSDQEKETVKSLPKEVAPWKSGLIIVLAGSMVMASYFINIKPYTASHDAISAIRSFSSGDFESTYALSSKTINSNTFVIQDAITMFSDQLMMYRGQMTSEDKARLFNLYLNTTGALIKRFPYNPKLYVVDVNLLSALANDFKKDLYPEVKSVIERAYTMSPYYPATSLLYIKVLIWGQEYDKAIEVSGRMLPYTANIADFNWLHGYALYKSNQKEKGLEQMEAALNMTTSFNSLELILQTADLFSENGQYIKALELLKGMQKYNSNIPGLDKKIQDLEAKINK